MPFPDTLNQIDHKTLGITWVDGHKSRYTVRTLRLECPCAQCVEEWSRRKIIREENIPLDVIPKKIESVGRYALNILWSDGHSTGIYTFEQLRNLCECSQCKAP